MNNIAIQRLYSQYISHPEYKNPADVVKWMGALQAQDYPGALWSIGLRMINATATYRDIEQAIADKKIIRTWPMRGTLHFVASEDVHWMLKLLTPRIIAGSARRRQQLELDERTLERSKELFSQSLQGGKQLSRKEMMDILNRAGIATANQRGYHILWYAAQTGLICFGPMRKKEQTFVLLDEWISYKRGSFDREKALAAVAKRYFTSHGPATLKDFVWWTGLSMADARAGLTIVAPKLKQERIEDEVYWMSPISPKNTTNIPSVYLLPGFDEYLLGYKDRRAVLKLEHTQKIVPGSNGMFLSTIVIDSQVAGTWKRILKKNSVTITPSFFTPISKTHQGAFNLAANRYGEFLGLPIV